MPIKALAKVFKANSAFVSCAALILAVSGCSEYEGNTGSSQGDNTKPVAVAQAITLGPPSDVDSNQYTTRAKSETTLTGKNSDSNSAPVMIFNWRQTDNSGHIVNLVERNATTVAFDSPNVSTETTLEFELEVQSANGNTDTDTISIKVLPGDDANHFLLNPSIPKSTYELVAVLEGGQAVGASALPIEFEVTTIAHWRNFAGADDQLVVGTETFSHEFPANFNPEVAYDGLADPRNPVFSIGIENIDADLVNYAFQDADQHRRIEAYDLDSAYLEHQINITNTSGLSFQLVPVDKQGQQINLSNIGDLIRYQLGMPNAISANNYYNLIDPDGKSATFSGWKEQAGFTDAYGNAADPNEVSALYLNNYDLGFGRDMHMRWDNDGNVYAYVENYPSVESGLKKLNEFAVVAMEYSDNPDPAGVNPKIVKFYAFVYDKRTGDYLRSTSLNFDGRGEKYLPESCAGCHQGYPGSRPYIDVSEADIGATFIPWDIGSFLFSDAHEIKNVETTLNRKEFTEETLQNYSRAAQEEAIRQFNIGTLKTMKHDTTRYAASIELIHGWYGDESMNLPVDELPKNPFNENYVQSGWVGQEELYEKVYAPHCRVCHTQAKNPDVNFDSYAEFMANTKLPSYVFERGLMPMARLTMDRFWTPNYDGEVPAELLRSHLASNGVSVVNSIPGAVIPNISITNQILPTIEQMVALDARESYFAAEYNWQMINRPAGSNAVLHHDSGGITSFQPDIPGGIYEIQLTVTGVHGDQQTVTRSITAADRVPAAECIIADASGFTASGALNDIPVLNQIPLASQGDGQLQINTPIADGLFGSVVVNNLTGTISYQLFNPFARGVDDLDYSVSDFDGSLSNSPPSCHKTPQPGFGLITIDSTPAGTLVPTAVNALPDAINNSHTININWQAPTGITPDSYKVFRDGVEISPPDFTNTLFNDSGLNEGSSFNYNVRTVVNGFESNNSATSTASTLSLMPGPVSVVANYTTEAELNWSAPAANFDYYSVYKDGLHYSDTAIPNLIDNAVSPGQTVSYQVSATDNILQESMLTVPVEITLPPEAPSNLQLSLDPVNDTSQVHLTWDTPGFGSWDYYNVYQNDVLIATPASNSYTNNSLSPYTDYSYRISAVANGAESASTLTQVIRTAAAGSTEPTNLVSNVNASADASSIDLSWDGPSGYTADYFSVYRDGVEIATNVLTTAFTDTGLNDGTSYSYTITAFYNTEESAPSNQVVESTLSLVPQALTASTISTTQIDLSWSAPAASADSYDIYRDGGWIASTTSTFYGDNTVMLGTDYSYTVTASQGATSSAASNTANATAAPNSPTGLLAQRDGTNPDTQINLSWSTVAGPVDTYAIYRDGAFIANDADGNYSDTGLVSGTSYSYIVRAVVNAQESADSNNEITATVPAAATALTSSRNASNPQSSIDLSWAAPGGNVESYQVYRDGAFVANTNLTNFTDTGLTSGTAYAYTVRSYANSLEAADSSSSTRETLPGTPTGLTATVNAGANTSRIDITWTPPSGGVTEYLVFINNAAVALTTNPNYAATLLDSDTLYEFKVQALYGGIESLNSPDSNTDTARTYVSWSNDINNNAVVPCVDCHVTTYPTMTSHMQSPRLPLCLSGDDASGYCDISNVGPMPQYQQTDPEYQLILRWINQGRLENN